MKPYVVKQPRPVPKHMPRKPNMSHPNDSLTGTLENWEEAVFRHAVTFATVKPLGMNKYDRNEFQTFPEALRYVGKYEDGKTKRYMIYAITKEERSFCIARNQWPHYAQLWKDTHR